MYLGIYMYQYTVVHSYNRIKEDEYRIERYMLWQHSEMNILLIDDIR